MNSNVCDIHDINIVIGVFPYIDLACKKEPAVTH